MNGSGHSRIFAEYNCRRFARRISRTRCSASAESVSTFDLIARSFAVKMSSKSSLPQSLTSVQLVLTGNSQLTNRDLTQENPNSKSMECESTLKKAKILLPRSQFQH